MRADAATSLPSASTSIHSYSTFAPHGPPCVPGPPSVALPRARTATSVPASAVGTKLALPGFWRRSSVVSLVSFSNTPSGRPPSASALLFRCSAVRLVSGSNTAAGSAVSALPDRSSPVTLSRYSKSPAFRATMSRPASCSVPTRSARTVAVTSEQLSTSAFATSASRTCGVRSHTPPVSAAVEPSTICAASVATASWPSKAAPWDPAMVPPASRMPFAGTATPSSSVSSAVTV